MNKTFAAAGVAALALGLAACGSTDNADNAAGSSPTQAPTEPLKVVADVTPHTELIKQAQDQGLLGDVQVEVMEISGQIDPNRLVQDGDMDANFFQHVPYLNDWNAKNGGNLVSVGAVHVEPLGLYSNKVNSAAEMPQGGTIAIPQDPTNLARALFLLEDAGLLTMNVQPTEGLDFSQVGTDDIAENPKGIEFAEIDRPQLAATLDDPQVDMSVINGNYALEAGLTPETDAKNLEPAEGNPYANVLVTRPELQSDPRVTQLATAFTSDEMKQFITENYKGSVVPAS